ncbi:leucine-rich repeats and immunoglobulin-like domains protein sma-10 [Tribolium castaneum]|uniref:Connectin-like Protein n=1 Tax=Tribolium castaneum TaxID=7070 RepID=D6WWU0_TRICA|nr:PREDICTED: P-granule-associated novel protein 1-like [Tribolium castaneum]EFA08761.1 Connectin-like Protein [Tribolium castaneum]|eukprot:XP_015838171.1 PREDICTED: P-granule-associated novel protein 1-like [Tribolium castaneum]
MCIFNLLLLFVVLQPTLSQHFNYIEIRYVKNNTVFVSPYADDVNFEKEITDIWIDNQTIPVLKTGSFQNLPKLKVIKIQDCGLDNIEDNAFENLPKLRILNLSKNHLKVVKNRTFSHLAIIKLYLAMNGIESLESGAFHNITNLEVIDLSGNKLRLLHTHMFRGTPFLRQIDFSFNKIETVASECFKGTFNGVGQGEDSFLKLNDNQMKRVKLGQLEGLYNIKELNFGNNIIEHVDLNTFKKFNSIEILNLENNQLPSLHDYVLRDLQSTIVYIDSNPLTCEFVKKFARWCASNKKDNTVNSSHLKQCNV